MIQAAESGLGIAFVYQSLVTQQLSAAAWSICYPTTAILPTISASTTQPETYSRPLRAFIAWWRRIKISSVSRPHDTDRGRKINYN
jgi:DNA-binding transcriptional LysR family regulator